jgi:hypothetical protein
MAHYFVTMDIEKPADPQLPVDRLAHIVREVLERLPLSRVATAEVRPMQPLGEMHTLEEL